MDHNISLEIQVEALPGSDITAQIIPEMVQLANRIGICVKASLNGVKTFAYPGDNSIHLAVAWERAGKSKSTYKMALARHGKEVVERA